MIRHSEDLSPAGRDSFDAILDVRSPGEFALDHVPGAINLPVLDDDERARVGTIYVQESHFQARRLGAALVAANIARHLQGALADRPAGFRPLIYCWRGGMRSAAMADVLAQVGWQTTLLTGGYRSWRRLVVATLHSPAPLPIRLGLLDGPTGVGKTAILGELARLGAQTLDLEALARHRGSLFGAMPGGQPTQKWFESRLFDSLQRQREGQLLFAEAESSRVGALSVPPALWAAMEPAPRILLAASEEARVRHILSRYSSIISDRAALLAAIDRLPGHLSAASRDEWRQLAAAGSFGELARQLIRAHYDPAYRRSQGRRPAAVLGPVDVGEDLALAARRILALASGAV